MKRVPPEERMERLLRENKRLRCELAWITAQRNRFERLLTEKRKRTS